MEELRLRFETLYVSERLEPSDVEELRLRLESLFVSETVEPSAM
jgi:hypothetical protein